jgi:hypothetical protein
MVIVVYKLLLIGGWGCETEGTPLGNRFVSFARAKRSCVRERARVGVVTALFLRRVGLWSRRVLSRGSCAFSRAPGVL